jgi:hypothetical protein
MTSIALGGQQTARTTTNAVNEKLSKIMANLTSSYIYGSSAAPKQRTKARLMNGSVENATMGSELKTTLDDQVERTGLQLGEIRTEFESVGTSSKTEEQGEAIVTPSTQVDTTQPIKKLR